MTSKQAVDAFDKALNLNERALSNYYLWASKMGTATGRKAVERADRQWDQAQALLAQVREHIAGGVQ